MNIKLIAHTQLSREFVSTLLNEFEGATDGQMVALSAIRTCYSHNKPSEIVELEGEKYFGSAAKDGEGGSEADRLIRHIMRSGHLSTTEHINFTFTIEGVSRSLLAQLTRHRHFSFSVQSQRYVKLESGSKSGGVDYTKPETINEREIPDYQYYDEGWNNYQAQEVYESFMREVQRTYDKLRKAGVPAEDARYILPNAATCNLVLTGNLRSILEFYGKRASKQAQWEIRELAEHMKAAVIEVEPWTSSFFQVK
ncbi:FAD-dependent thymidylate synthase [Cytobacillus sp. FSL R5-0596]|uniref:FAD-dependent thymidylate synthase n=1 Tax=Cytobacillus sp. FSL R5-0596 TaxID=2954696 RepID=UPI0030F70C4A